MLDQMRNNARNWLIYLLFGAIIIVFSINFGPGFDRMGQAGCRSRGGTAAVVNDEPISRYVFLMQWRNFIQYRRIPRNLLKSWDFKGRLLNSLIDNVLLAQLADKHGVIVSEDDIYQRIIADPSFHKNGVFDPVLFRRVVTNMLGMTSDEYKEYLRRTMQAERMRTILASGVVVSQREVKQSYIRSHSKVRLQFVALDPSKIQLPVSITKKELTDFINKNQKKIKEYYDKHLNLYKRAEKIKASHILLKLSSNATSKEVAAKRKKLEDIRQKLLKKPGMFFVFAAKYSEGPTKTKGGNLGFFGRGAMDPAFEKAAFALKKINDISPIVRSRFGLHIIQLTGRIKPLNRKFSDPKVQKEIATQLLKKQKALQALQKVATQMQMALKKGKSFKEILKAYAAKSTKKATTKKATSQPTTMLSQALILQKLAGKLKLRTTPAFTQESDNVPLIGKSGKLVRLAFSLTKKNPAPSQPIEVNGKLFVIKLKKKIQPNMKEFEAERAELTKRLLNRKRQEFIQAWIEKLRKKAKIKKNKKLLSYGNAA